MRVTLLSAEPEVRRRCGLVRVTQCRIQDYLGHATISVTEKHDAIWVHEQEN